MGRSTQPPGGFLHLSLPFTDTFVTHHPAAFPETWKETSTPSPLPPRPVRNSSASQLHKEEVKVTRLLPLLCQWHRCCTWAKSRNVGSFLPQRLKSSLTCGVLLWHWDTQSVHPRAKGLKQKEMTSMKIIRHCHRNTR